jgi:hypothetical protein
MIDSKQLRECLHTATREVAEADLMFIVPDVV